MGKVWNPQAPTSQTKSPDLFAPVTEHEQLARLRRPNPRRKAPWGAGHRVLQHLAMLAR